MTDFIYGVNAFAWVAGNLLVAYSSLAVLVFVIMYYVLFDPSATSAGTMIFRFIMSIVGILFLIFVGIYIDSSGDLEWTSLPTDVDAWQPVVRLIVYGYLSFTITSLAILLFNRKWRPEKVKSAPDRDMVKVRHTKEIPIIKPDRHR